MVYMKLIFCGYCGDLVRIHGKYWTYCKCGASKGMYISENHAEILGDRCVPIGIGNSSIVTAANYYLAGECPSHMRTKEGWLFDAFVFARDSPVITRVDH